MASTILNLSTAFVIPPTSARSNKMRIHMHAQCGDQDRYASSSSMAPRARGSSGSVSDVLVHRRSANYPPNIWEDSYIQSLPIEFKDEEETEKIRKLKEDVRHQILREKDLSHQLQLVDELQQLGLSYHFQDEIKDVLTSIYEIVNNTSTLNQYDIYTTSLLFRLLREHGFHISADIFNHFKDDNGRFNTNLQKDSKGMLGLYEASFHKMEGDDQMDEAREFAEINLRVLAETSHNSLINERVAYALELPLHYRAERPHHRWFINMYEREENTNLILLKLAKWDYNAVQSTYKRELKELSRWWTSLELRTMGFARDRLVENYLWAVGWVYEPKYWRSREVMTKAITFITLIDDIYDVYGSLEELELFTEAVERWDANAIEQLPDYMKICFMALFNTFNDTAYRNLKLKGVDTLPHLRKEWAVFCKAHLLEARWYHGGYKPTFKEYIDNAWISVSGPLIITIACCSEEDITQKPFEFFDVHPDAVRHSSTIMRLIDDLGTSPDELKRGDVPKSIQCYMHENNVSEAVAIEHIKDMIGSSWKDLNGEHLASSSFVEPYKKLVTNMPRIAQLFYQYGDGYAESAKLTKETVIDLLIKPIQL